MQPPAETSGTLLSPDAAIKRRQVMATEGKHMKIKAENLREMDLIEAPNGDLDQVDSVSHSNLEDGATYVWVRLNGDTMSRCWRRDFEVTVLARSNPDPAAR